MINSNESWANITEHDFVDNHKAYIIVVGNEKGGAGKTTTCVHLIMALKYLGFNVASIDVDSRQASLTRYLDNRRKNILKTGIELPFPKHSWVRLSNKENKTEARIDEENRFFTCLKKYAYDTDFVIIDTPGSDSNLSRYAHSFADTILTPVNDSLIDLDVIAKIRKEKLDVEQAGIYSHMVWEQKMKRANRDKQEINWVVIPNRLSTLDSKNKQNVKNALLQVSKRLGFIVGNGFTERVIFRELFLDGLTLLDTMDENLKVITPTLSHIAGRRELREFLLSLQIKLITDRIEACGNMIPQKVKEFM